MRYQRVYWRQELPEFPVMLYSEIDEDNWEVRKIDEYADGRRDLAASGLETGRTFLGLDRVPRLDSQERGWGVFSPQAWFDNWG